MSRRKPTRTTNPIHFEDLDPKRFEDLVRELIYDFREWQSIEATGKGGGDDGFDIRAYERTTTTALDDEGNEIIRPMDGNLWMIQCKREKSVSPSKIRKILEDIDPDNPPYGYILAAATNFSKKSYDIFREILTRLGVFEFHLWGNATLETELHQPKNDRILFTFFGISNVTRRRSRATEIRSEVTNKNRIMRILGDNISRSWILARDSKDRHYPFEFKYADFDQMPRWQDYEVTELHPRGVLVSLKQCYAWFDEEKKTFDVAEPSIPIRNPYDRTNYTTQDREKHDSIDLVRDFWERLPKKNRAMFHVNGIIRYEDMLVIDEKGDNWRDVPHIFVDFLSGSAVSNTVEYLTKGERQIGLDDFSREVVFPKSFSKPQFGRFFIDESLKLPDGVRSRIVNFQVDCDTLYDVDGRFSHLQPGDIAVIKHDCKDDRFIQITHRYRLLGSEMLKNEPRLALQIRQQIGRDANAEDVINVLEFRICYEHQWKKTQQATDE
ncbi:restriction endonuclease [uncultured Ruegeria sp.]|uniref:restriction endonuclease n=1 Tax=uncultured Ruegeria sp. TaxID=259304 RepID=UPI00261CAE8B|nr:restriction endonuclease [uncultured Ruegeria sp.]